MGKDFFKSDYFLAFLLLIIGCLIVITYFIGPSNPDEFLYLWISKQINENGIQDYLSRANTSLRYLKVIYNILVYLPVKLFGYNFFSYTFISVLSYLLTSILIYFFVKKINGSSFQAFAASIFFMTIPASVFYSTLVLPEMIHCLTVFISITITILAAKKTEKNGIYFLIAGIFWGISLYLREHSVFIFPVFIFLVFKYMKNVKYKFLNIIAGYLLIFIVVNGIVYLFTGDFLYQWSFAKLRFGGVNPENTKFFEPVGSRLYYTYALLTRVDFFGLYVIMITLIMGFLVVNKNLRIIIYDDIFYILVVLFFSYEILYRFILPAPRTIAYISPMFPFIAIYISGLLFKTAPLIQNSVRKCLGVFSFILIFCALFLVVLKNIILDYISNLLNSRDNYLLNSEIKSEIFYNLLLIAICIIITVTIITLLNKKINRYSFQVVSITILLTTSLLFFIPVRIQKHVDYVLLNKDLCDFISNSEFNQIFVHHGYQRSPLICYSGYRISDGYINSNRDIKDKKRIKPFSEIDSSGEGLLIVDDLLLERQINNKEINYDIYNKIMAIKSGSLPVFRKGKISVYYISQQ